jgi:hypothetical protein
VARPPVSKPAAVKPTGPAGVAGGTRTLKRAGTPNPAGAPNPGGAPKPAGTPHPGSAPKPASAPNPAGAKPAKRTSAVAPAKPADAGPRDAKPAEVRSVAARPVEAKPADLRPADLRPADLRPADLKPADPKTADPKAVSPKAAESRAAEPKTLEAKTVEAKTVEAKTVEAKTVEAKTVEARAAEVKPAGPKPAVLRPAGGRTEAGRSGTARTAAKPADGRPATNRAGPVPAREDGFPLWPDAGQAPAPAAEPKPPAGSAPWPAPQLRPGQMASSRRPPVRIGRRATRQQLRPPALGLALLLLFALLSGFFGWVSADPFWLSVGHAETGTARVTKCAGSGLGARCVGTFTGARFSRDRVALGALPPASHRPGVTVPARMVSSKGRIAYVGNPAALHIRWVLGFVLVALCGVGIAWATGAGRLSPKQARLGGYATSIGAPLLLLIGTLVATW